jgi:hypothetical protein
MRFLVCLLFLVAAFCTVCRAQSRLSGLIKSASGQPVPDANVLLLRAQDSSFIKASVSDNTGAYVFDAAAQGRYIMAVSTVGIKQQYSEPFTVAGQDIVLPVFSLNTEKTLEGVTVQAQKPLIEIKADKLIVNVENSIINTGATVLEVLGRSPGVSVDQSDVIRLKGRPGLTIMMDGKIVPVQGADLATLLKGMPASAIEKIEIISNPGARYDAAGSGGIINLKTRRDKRMGFNGTLTTTYGQGVYHKSNTSIMASYKTKKLSLNGGYTYGNRGGFNNLAIQRFFYQPGGMLKTTYSQTGQTAYPVSNHNGNLSADYNLTAKTTIGASATADNANVNPRGDNFSRVDSSDTYSFFSTSNRSEEEWYNYSVNGYARHNFDSSGQSLSVDVDYARFWSQTYQRYTNKYYNREGGFLLPDYLWFGDLKGFTQIRSIKADYALPLKGGAKLEAGIKSSLVTADNSLDFYNYSTNVYVHDSGKSNHFLYRENINAFYANLSKDAAKWSYQLGLRGEQTIAHGDQVTTGSTFDRKYFQMFPSFAVQRHLNEQHDLGLTLSRRIDRPNYRQLNPFRYFLDPTNSRIGNPYLRPSLYYNVELSHTYMQKFVSTASFSIGNDIIVETLEADTLNPNTSINSDKNLAKQYYYSYSGSYPIQVMKKWTATTNVTAYYAYYQGNLSRTPLNAGQFAVEANVTNTISLPWGINAELSAYYQTPMRWGYYEMKSISAINLGLQKSFLNKKLNVKIAFNDWFRKSSPRATMHFNNFTEHFTAIRDTRVFMLSLTYRFGQNPQSSRRHSSGAEDEKRRASGG